jgi:hypothetical protein
MNLAKRVERAAMPKPICIRPNCGKTVFVRGLCPTDYAIASRLVRKGATSWAMLEGDSKALPPLKKQREGITAWFLSDDPKGETK